MLMVLVFVLMASSLVGINQWYPKLMKIYYISTKHKPVHMMIEILALLQQSTHPMFTLSQHDTVMETSYIIVKITIWAGESFMSVDIAGLA